MTESTYKPQQQLGRLGDEPQTPVRAFEQFIEVIRTGPAGRIAAPPEDLFALLRPFLVNPQRHTKPVQEIVSAIGWAQVYRLLEAIPGMRGFYWFMGRWGPLRGTMEQYAPDLVKHLQSLEESLARDLRPGSALIHVKPIRYIDTPSGYGELILHRYRFEAQVAVEPNSDDEPEAVDVKLTIEAPEDEIVIDAIRPEPGFSVVGVKRSSGIQLGRQEATMTKDSVESEVSGGVAKVKGTAEVSSSEQASSLFSLGAEQTISRVEQYLVARKAGKSAFWRALAGVGPLDVGGIDYSADVLVPDSVVQLTFRFEALVEWHHVGGTPAEALRTFILPRPKMAR